MLSFAGVTARWEASGSHLDETRIRPERPAPPQHDVRFDIGPQHAGAINNVGRDQYNAYVQQRESFLREVAATKSKARLLAWAGFLLLVVGFVIWAGTIFGFIQRVSSFDESTQPGDVELLGPSVAGVPVGIIGYGLGFLGSVLLVVGIVLHIVAAARRRRVDREMPLPHPSSWPH